jgi:hypothetical protein
MFRPRIADVFNEEHHQQIVLVLTSIDRPSECITGTPEDIIYLILIDWEEGDGMFVHVGILKCEAIDLASSYLAALAFSS